MDNNENVTAGGYEIEIAGRVTSFWDERLYSWEITVSTPSSTIIAGVARDQTELYGVLSALRNMGLTLLRVEQQKPKVIKQES